MSSSARFLAITLALSLAACVSSRENDPVYQQLKANPPTEIPARHLADLRKGYFSCDVYNEGDRARQYMTCWWPGGAPSAAALTYFRPNPLRPPVPSIISVPDGAPVTEFIPFP